jgi:hypothetical protein
LTDPPGSVVGPEPAVVPWLEEGCVLGELGGAVVAVQVELEVIMPEVLARVVG